MTEYKISSLTSEAQGLIEIRERLIKDGWLDAAIDLKIRLIILQLPEDERDLVQADYQVYVEGAGKTTRAELAAKQLRFEASVLGCSVAELQESNAEWDTLTEEEQYQLLAELKEAEDACFIK